ncbi:MAG TPA: hypothetical protein VFZ52_21795 [Chryseolinea sp.]
MKFKIICVLSLAGLLCCDNIKNDVDESRVAGQLEGTWQLRSGTIIEKDDTTVTEYSKKQSMIKIINKTHFAFLNHDLKKGKDSTALFAAGGGVYTLDGDQYTEYLEYCSAREWEGNTFQFTVKVSGDTLRQSGTEKIENLGIERMNIEIYTRVED